MDKEHAMTERAPEGACGVEQKWAEMALSRLKAGGCRELSGQRRARLEEMLEFWQSQSAWIGFEARESWGWDDSGREASSWKLSPVWDGSASAQMRQSEGARVQEWGVWLAKWLTSEDAGQRGFAWVVRRAAGAEALGEIDAWAERAEMARCAEAGAPSGGKAL